MTLISPVKLHKLVQKNLPKTTLKPGSFWVGILSHDISEADKVTDRSAFIFIKANPVCPVFDMEKGVELYH